VAGQQQQKYQGGEQTVSGAMIAFFILSTFIFTGAVFMLNFTRVVHMIFSIAFTFLSIAGIYILLNAEFIAVVQIILYTGAVSILAVFGIMMTRHDAREEEKPRKAHKLFAFLVTLAFLGIMIWVIQSTPWGDQVAQFAEENVKEIGTEMFTKFVIPFEMVSVLLLIALVGAIIMAKEDKES
jgi:NADH-quinone oxidoreductase subunit J